MVFLRRPRAPGCSHGSFVRSSLMPNPNASHYLIGVNTHGAARISNGRRLHAVNQTARVHRSACRRDRRCKSEHSRHPRIGHGKRSAKRCSDKGEWLTYGRDYAETRFSSQCARCIRRGVHNKPAAHCAGESRFCGRGANCERHLGNVSLHAQQCSYNSFRCHSPRGSRLGRTPSRRRSEQVAWARSIAHTMHV